MSPVSIWMGDRWKMEKIFSYFFYLFRLLRLFHWSFYHMNSSKYLNVAYFALNWFLIYFRKMNCQLGHFRPIIKYTNEFMGFKIEWKSLKRREIIEKSKKKFQNFSSGHPSKYWPSSMLLQLSELATNWPPKNHLKMALIQLRSYVHWN